MAGTPSMQRIVASITKHGNKGAPALGMQHLSMRMCTGMPFLPSSSHILTFVPLCF